MEGAPAVPPAEVEGPGDGEEDVRREDSDGGGRTSASLSGAISSSFSC